MNFILPLILLLSQVAGSPVHVRDGDTITVDGVAVRLNGVDAPEMDTPYGPASRAAMQDLVATGDVVCELTGEKTYDRFVGTCFIDDHDIGAALIAQGHALDCARYSHGRYRHLEPAGIRRRLPQAGYC